MQNAIQKFKQSSIVFEKRGILSQNLKTSNMKFKNELQISCSSMFFAGTSHRFSTYNCLKRGMWNFLNWFRSWVICKNRKKPGFCTLVFYTFINNSRSKQNKKNPTHRFVNITN